MSELTNDELVQLILEARAIEYAYNLDQWTTEALKPLLKSLRQAQKEILTYLDNSGANITDWSETRSIALLDNFRNLTIGARSALGENITQIATAVGVNAIAIHSDILSFGGRLEPFNNVSMTPAQLRSFVVETPLGGKVMKEWVDSVYDFNIQQQIKGEIFTGVLKGEDYSELVGRIRTGFGIAEKDAIDLARGYVQSANVGAQEIVGRQNEEVVRGLKWTAALETSYKKSGRGTCIMCASLDGSVYKFDEPHPPMPLHFRCFVSPKVPIYTSKGWKPIASIEVGDLVLTHKKRFRRVTELIFTPKQSPNIIRIYINSRFGNKLCKGKKHYVTITEDHPVMVNNHWVLAKDVCVGDKISYLANTCKRCGKSIPHYHKYCSRTCLSLDITDKQWADPEHRKNMSEKISKKNIEQYENGERDRYKQVEKANIRVRELIALGEFNPNHNIEGILNWTKSPEGRKSHSDNMRNNNPMDDLIIREKARLTRNKFFEENPDRHPNRVMAKNRWNGNRTYIEQKIEEYLKEIEINYEFNHPIKRYFIDFALLDYKIAIECDGEFWHQDKEYDERRQREIEELGWLFLRFSGKQIVKDFSSVAEEIQRILANHNKEYELVEVEVTDIERQKLKKSKTLYNFSVEEDESYIANGFVVHNCRCIWTYQLIPWKELGLDIPELEAAYRPYTIRPNINIGTGRKGKILDSGFIQGSYSDFMASQSDRFQKNVLGPKRFALYDSGKLSLKDFVDQKTGKLIRIKDLPS